MPLTAAAVGVLRHHHHRMATPPIAATRAAGAQARGRVVRRLQPTTHSFLVTTLDQAAAQLYDIPVSNHGARNRHLIYGKGLQDVVEVVSPAALGGMKSDEYLALNPQGKVPLLVLEDGTAIPEVPPLLSCPEHSEVINQYLLDKYADRGPSFAGATPEERAQVALLTRIHDCYISPIQGTIGPEHSRVHQQPSYAAQAEQGTAAVLWLMGALLGCMYRAGFEPADRADKLAELVRQMDIIEVPVARVRIGRLS
eukprot:scaffold1129_cov376-Prasinococcus_capsulatus_cf.AAC.7